MQGDSLFLSSRRRHTVFDCDWSSDVSTSNLTPATRQPQRDKRKQHREQQEADHCAERPVGDEKVRAVVSGAETLLIVALNRSEERRVGKECRSRWSPYH